MADFPPVRITIPTYNAAADIDRTLDSIEAQEYQETKIFTLIVDFGSTDGTVEKILARSGKRLGLMQLPHAHRGRTAAATAWKQNALQGGNGLPLTLEQGDCLYPAALRRLVAFRSKALRHVAQPLVAADVDIRLADGTTKKSSPLYTTPCFFRANSDDCIAFVERGFQHRVLTFGSAVVPHCDTGSTFSNQRSYWNSLSTFAIFASVAYLPEALCLRKEESALDDPLDDILFRMDTLISLSRMVEDAPEIYVLGEKYDVCARRQLALYSLWRASLAARQGTMLDAEDCFLMARIIDDTITSEPVWADAQSFFTHNSQAAWEKFAMWWERPEVPVKPRRPLPVIKRGASALG